MMALRLAAGVAVVFSVCATPAAAQLLQGSAEERQACQRDAVKFCREAASTNDTFRVLACLQSNRTKISKPCQKVLESHGQ